MAAAITLFAAAASHADPLPTADELAALPLVERTNLPPAGTYWLLSGPVPGHPYPPLPIPPPNIPEAPIYIVGQGLFLVDDSQVDYPALRQQQEMERALRSLEQQYGMQSEGEPPPPPTGGGSEWDGTNDPPVTGYAYPSNSLWLSISQPTNGLVPLTIHGTVPDVRYEILSRQSLTDTAWYAETNISGAPDQDWTPTTVPVGDRTNSLFLWCRSWIDGDGNGIPDWWEQFYFGTTGVDPYAEEASHDGWTILQAYENGWNPNDFHTPPPPQNVRAVLDASGTNVVISWNSGGGPVTNYVIQLVVWYSWGGYITNTIGTSDTSTFAFTNNPGLPFSLNPPPPLSYLVSADFATGQRIDGQLAPLTEPALSPEMGLVRGPNGDLYLTVPAPAADLSRIRLFWYSLVSHSTVSSDFDGTNLANGVMRIPREQMAGYSVGNSIRIQLFATDSRFGAGVTLSPSVPAEAAYTGAPQPPYRFADCQRHLKENLQFLLQSATLTETFSYVLGSEYGRDPADVGLPETHFARPASPPEYEYSGFHVFSANLNYSVMQEFRPVMENYLWRNLAYDAGDFGPNLWTNGVFWEYEFPSLRVLSDPHYVFACTNCDPPPLALSVTNHPYEYARCSTGSTMEDYTNGLAEVGVWLDGFSCYVPRGQRNVYGLPLDAVLIGPGGLVDLQAGAPPFPGYWDPCYSFCRFETPALHTVDYYFASQTPYFNYNPQFGTPRPAMPGSPDFGTTNTSPLLITGLGQPITVSAWAKQEITNGYAGVYAYLEQYFDRAYTGGADGNPTANEAGLLSPYGEFFPTQPGPAAIVTMPDIDPPHQAGTGTVHVIKLQLDVNHDGDMDLSFGGPDNTSQGRPFVFWINNDNDGTGVGTEVRTDAMPPDYTTGRIRSLRNLEDFARLWVCGLPSLPMFDGYGVRLSWRNTNGSPAINLYEDAASDGGVSYLTDPEAAETQVAETSPSTGCGLTIGTVGSNGFTFSDGYFAQTGNKHFLFEGAGVGSGELVLTVFQGSNVLAQTSAWVEFRRVQDLFDHARITNVVRTFPSMRNSTNVSGFTDEYEAPPGIDESRQIIVLVHGWNNDPWQSENYAETMFKRLYWQGYRGRFVALRWPTLSGETDPWTSLLTYNRSEYVAFRSAAGAAACFNTLRSRFPDYALNVCAHSMGNIVVMEALRLHLAAATQSIDNYVLMEAAVPAHCYDTNVAACPGLLFAETPAQTPDTYRGYPGAIEWAMRPGGHAFNFFNTNDFALRAWVSNQLLNKPDGSLGYYIVPPLQPYLLLNIPLTDPREVMAFVARPRSYAMGAQPGVGGAVGGAEVDLNAAFGFGGRMSDHSGQFTRSIQEVSGFYSTLVQTLAP